MPGLYTASRIVTLPPSNNCPITRYKTKLRSYYSEEGTQSEFVVSTYDPDQLNRIVHAWENGQHQLIRDVVGVVEVDRG